MPHALLPGTELTHGVVWVTAHGRIDIPMAITLARAASNAAIRHGNPLVLFDFRKGRLLGGVQGARQLAGTFSCQTARRVTASVVLLTTQIRPEFRYLERAFGLRGIRVARFDHWEDALHWLGHTQPNFDPVTGETRAVVKSFVESRLGIPRTQLERELADLYLCLQQLAANRGVNALRGAARVEGELPALPRPRLSIVRSNRRPLRSA